MFSLVRAVSFLLLSYFADPVECLPQPSVGPQLNATIACQKLIQFFLAMQPLSYLKTQNFVLISENHPYFFKSSKT